MADRETRCAWVIPPDEPDARYMVPGCPERVQDWDAECTCPTTAEQLDEFEAKIRELEAEAMRASDRSSALIAVIGRFPNARELLDEVNQKVREWDAMRKRVAS